MNPEMFIHTYNLTASNKRDPPRFQESHDYYQKIKNCNSDLKKSSTTKAVHPKVSPLWRLKLENIILLLYCQFFLFLLFPFLYYYYNCFKL